MSNREKACRNYFRTAVRDLRSNPHLASYLLGLAHAWHVTGAISEETHTEMVNKAKSVWDERRRA